MSAGRIEPRCRRQQWSDAVEVFFATFSGDKLFVAEPLTMTQQGVGSHISRPAVVLAREDAQRLIDELWNVGLRPSEGTGSAGSLAATERHLADMREIATAALKKLGVRP